MEEKEFIIPKNVNAGFEIIQNVGLKDMLFFIPSIVFNIPFIWFVSVNPIVKIVVAVFSIFIPFVLVFVRPIKENIPAWKHLSWKYDFIKRQKKFYYRKEVSEYVQKTK